MRTVQRGVFVWKLRHPDLDGDWLQHPERLLKEGPSFRKARSLGPQARVVRFNWSGRNLVLKEYADPAGAAWLGLSSVDLGRCRRSTPRSALRRLGSRRSEPSRRGIRVRAHGIQCLSQKKSVARFRCMLV